MLFHGRRERWDYLLKDLENLQKDWEGKSQFQDRGRGLWLPAVLFGIDIGRARIAEEVARSNSDLRRLVAEWKRVLAFKPTGPTDDSIQGIDFGIRLVIRRVHRYLNLEFPPRSKPPGSADGTKSRSAHNGTPGA